LLSVRGILSPLHSPLLSPLHSPLLLSPLSLPLSSRTARSRRRSLAVPCRLSHSSSQCVCAPGVFVVGGRALCRPGAPPLRRPTSRLPQTRGQAAHKAAQTLATTTDESRQPTPPRTLRPPYSTETRFPYHARQPPQRQTARPPTSSLTHALASLASQQGLGGELDAPVGCSLFVFIVFV
jgi:hypothetical protein